MSTHMPNGKTLVWRGFQKMRASFSVSYWEQKIKIGTRAMISSYQVFMYR
jgi:hypothetical protein